MIIILLNIICCASPLSVHYMYVDMIVLPASIVAPRS